VLIGDEFTSVQDDRSFDAFVPPFTELPEPPAAKGFIRNNRLKLALIGGDALALLGGAVLGQWLSGYATDAPRVDFLITTALFLVAGLWSIRSQGLLLARASAVRVVELTKIARACVLLGIGMLLADRLLQLGLHIEQTAISCLIIMFLLVVWRSAFRSYMAHARLRGRFMRPTVIVGSDVEAYRLVSLVATHRELGVDVVGLVGDRSNAERTGIADLWLGDIDDTERLVRESGASGVLVSPNGLDPLRFNALIRNLQRDGLHIFLTTGLAGIEARRLRSMSLAHEPVLYVEAPKFNRAQSLLKRVFDIGVASLLLVLASPVMLFVALVVKLADRGPVFYRQERVGKNGATFRLVKFRTMRVGADRDVHRLAGTNERSGPLFKMTSDPRVTRPGRWLRETSLDELPQLFNVLRGQMSLVGPRPALPSEVEKFSPELRMREMVLPGITGLWQVEARDNPSFEAYRRLDLFYVENWSITLDLLIVVATIEHIAVRLLTMVTRRFRRTPEVLALPAGSATETR
jgi:exopolysaccharide biosynthesis polyprenyl glycosylphosphotransferase